MKIQIKNFFAIFRKNPLRSLLAELVNANQELAIQNNEKAKRAAELVLANQELTFQNKEKEKRADELVLANRELALQNKEKEKRAAELVIANQELAIQNDEKAKRAAELVIANQELAIQNDEKAKRAAELVVANQELAFQNDEKAKRAAELVIANQELTFQNQEKEKRADELVIANRELAFQNEEKAKRAAELVIANKELTFQNQEKEKRAVELVIANQELAFQHDEKAKRAAELLITNAYLENLINIANAPIIVWDAQFRITRFNHAFEILTGHSEAIVLGQSPELLFPPALAKKSMTQIRKTSVGKRWESVDIKILNRDASVRTLLWNSATLFEPDGKTVLATIAQGQDITMRKLAEQALQAANDVLEMRVLERTTDLQESNATLREAHLQLERIIEGTRAGTWVWNVLTGETIFNEEWAQLVGYTLAELLPSSITTFEKLAHPEDLKHCYELIDRHFAGDLPYLDIEIRMKHSDRHWVWIHNRGRVINRTQDGKPLMMFGTHTDITERKLNEEKIQLLNTELEKLSVTDTLTQINNRRYFMQRAAEEIQRESRNNQHLVLLMMDLDEFKKINDTYGHAAGDLVLQHFAAVLSANIREIDIPGRIGGEEFAVLLPNTTLQDAVILAERMRQSIENASTEISGQAVKITVSIGAAEYNTEMTSINALYKNADQAMYQAKHSGRNRVVIFREDLPLLAEGFH